MLKYQGMVYSACARVLGNPSEAEDAAQETFLKLARGASGITREPASWLYACALNVARNKRRSTRARQDRERKWTEMQNGEAARDWQELIPVIDECIAELPAGDRELLQLLCPQAQCSVGWPARPSPLAWRFSRARLGRLTAPSRPWSQRRRRSEAAR